MSKRKVKFEDTVASESAGDNQRKKAKPAENEELPKEGKWNRTFKSNHTLDSDEEADDENYEIEETNIVEGKRPCYLCTIVFHFHMVIMPGKSRELGNHVPGKFCHLEGIKQRNT